jgi:hypothetical protein
MATAFRCADSPAPAGGAGRLAGVSAWADSDRTRAVLLALACAGAVASAAVLSPHEAEHGPVICPFRRVTGLPCPGCGLTRAWVLALHGRCLQALEANPFVLITLPLAVGVVLAVAGAFTLAVGAGRDVCDLLAAARSTARRRGVRWSVRVVVGCWLGYAVVRAFGVATGHLTA